MLYAGDEAMTESLEEAFAKASRLPPEEQDALAAWLLKELESEDLWDRLFARSQDALEKLAEEALAEHRGRETEQLDLRQI